ncbi:MAG TPA: aminoglycoside phosphotransferase family protein [Candidatus Saccharimonadales bacterium]
MPTRYLGNQPAEALAVAKKLYPHETEFKVINDGQENLIITVRQAYNVRFPRNEEIWQRSLAERSILARLTPLTLPTPKLISVSESPAYIQTSYLKGKHLDVDAIRKAPIAVQQRVGKEIATFTYQLHQALPVAAIKPLLVSPTWSYDDYLKRVLDEQVNPNPQINALAKHYYNAWMHKKQIPKKIIIHDDLHTSNLLFSNNHHLTGVLDFGAACMGNPEQELRQTYRLGDIVFDAAIAMYEELSGQSLDRETAKLWTITQELGSYCREDSDAVHARAFDNLCYWFPQLKSIG